VDQIAPNSEFSRLRDVSELPTQGLTLSIEATSAELEALCRRFELKAVHALEARVRIERTRDPQHGPAIRVQAVLHAEVTQECGVTLESFQVDVDEDFSILFQFGSHMPARAGAVDDVLDEDAPEPLEVPEIDAGELVAQHMALALDPYPRRPGVALESSAKEAQIADLSARPNSPFAKLGQLKHKM